MKVRLSAVAVFLFLAAQAHADNYGMAGCGIGALAFKDQPGKIQIVAATLNDIISPQTFAITTGTSNCTEVGNSASMFISVNKVALQKDISRGSGESLNTLSKLLKCSDSNMLGHSLQQNYGSIFPSESTSAEEVDKSIHSTIKNDKVLAQSCQVVG